MLRAVALVLVLCAGACGSQDAQPQDSDATNGTGDGGTTPDASTAEDAGNACATDASYDGFVQPLFVARCLTCHSATLDAAARNGAPPTANFDTVDDVAVAASLILLRAVDTRTMPPGAPLDDCEVQRLGDYLEGAGAEMCQPDCDGRSCGNDGCEGSCGLCGPSELCDEAVGQCTMAACIPTCQGVSCGDDGCGGSCGTCGPGLSCDDVTGACFCEPQCDGRGCGDDGCGGTCGSCTGQSVCGVDGSCVCVPGCDGKLCGDDGCGGSCGACPFGLTCTAPDACTCVGDCADKACGDDGCGGTCGSCMGILSCDTRIGSCVVSCQPDCSGRQCGDDGCGGSCGSCGGGEYCDLAGLCECAPDCFGRACGDDGCGGSCGVCPGGTLCSAGQCACNSDCSGRVCGGDGCGGSCGDCGGEEVCAGGACVEQCIPDCSNLSCGDDGCGGSCGSCGNGSSCVGGQCDWPQLGFAADVYPILSGAGCGSIACHGGARPAERLDLSSSGAAYGDLVDVASNQCQNRLRVTTGDPDSSYLVNKVTGVGLCFGTRMPKVGQALSSQQIDIIRGWIGGGAAP